MLTEWHETHDEVVEYDGPPEVRFRKSEAIQWENGYPSCCPFCLSEDYEEFDSELDNTKDARVMYFWWTCNVCRNSWYTGSVISEPFTADEC